MALHVKHITLMTFVEPLFQTARVIGQLLRDGNAATVEPKACCFGFDEGSMFFFEEHLCKWTKRQKYGNMGVLSHSS